MKKTLFSILFVISSIVAFSQFQGGPKIGLNLADFGGSDSDSVKMRLSFNIGGYAFFPISDKIGIHTELLYNSVGGKVKEDGSDPFLGTYSVEAAIKMNYISLPVMLQYN